EQDRAARHAAVWALAKIIDIELAIMLEAYREAFVDQVQDLERREKIALERQLALTQARYDQIVERGEALVATFDAEGKILLFNHRCERVTGIDRRAAAGRSWCDLFVAPERHALCQQVLTGEHPGALEEPVPGQNRRVRWHFTRLPDLPNGQLRPPPS